MYKLKIIIASTRPGRAGIAVGNWFNEEGKKNPNFEIEVLDLKEIDLPFLDEPELPLLQKYTKEHTKAWSKKIDEADAFVIVTPEYNFAIPASLKNAMDFLYVEWNYKPVGFVSYGGPAGGARSVIMAKQIATTLKMMPMYEGVSIPFISKVVENGKFKNTEDNDKAAAGMLEELIKWTKAMKTMRE